MTSLIILEACLRLLPAKIVAQVTAPAPVNDVGRLLSCCSSRLASANVVLRLDRIAKLLGCLLEVLLGGGRWRGVTHKLANFLRLLRTNKLWSDAAGHTGLIFNLDMYWVGATIVRCSIRSIIRLSSWLLVLAAIHSVIHHVSFAHLRAIKWILLLVLLFDDTVADEAQSTTILTLPSRHISVLLAFHGALILLIRHISILRQPRAKLTLIPVILLLVFIHSFVLSLARRIHKFHVLVVLTERWLGTADASLRLSIRVLAHLRCR